MFSNSTKYAIRTIVYLSQKEAGHKCTVEEIAADLDIPKPYLSKVLQQLSKADLISSLKGRGGGFYLTTENKRRNLIDVVICMDGKNVFNQCLLGLPQCNEKNPCLLHSEFKKFKSGLEKSVVKKSINKLIEEWASNDSNSLEKD